jgi:glyoxylase-like metal-dependent hydrolase (beta-lactamase superfamily II)
VIQEIDVSTLHEWLSRKVPVTVLDVRPTQDREQWWIPGSRHVDAYEALKAGSPGALADTPLPADRPVVTVCGAGRVSLKAAEVLAATRGIAALSLRGGMKAWSAAWNTASHSFGPVDVIQVRRTGKGCLSYLIHSNGEAAVIDPAVEPDVFLSLAQASGARIRYVFDTHIHADHLSRARRVSERSGAPLILPRQDRVGYDHTPAADGDRFFLGAVAIEVLATPGHTGESVSYLLPHAAVFTGDTLFLSGVGRPDLHAGSEGETEARARALFRSLQKLASLEGSLWVLPGHTAEPVAFDGVLLTATVAEVRGRINEWLRSEDEFVARIMQRIPPAPPNYVRITELNEAGEWPDGDPADLEAGANRCAVR